MRPFHTLPLLAAFALAACADDAAENPNDAALAAGDVAAVIEDNGEMPAPGEYTTTVSLVEFDAPGLDDATMSKARTEFEAGAGEPNLYCVTGETTREAWFSEMTEAACTLSQFTADGNQLDGVMTCSADEGLNGRVEVSGRTAQGGSDLTMNYTLPTAAGEGTVRMRVVSQRVGDCG